MEINDVRKALRAIRSKRFAIDNTRLRLIEMGHNQKVISSYSETVQSSSKGSNLENAAIRLLEYKEKIYKKILDYYEEVEKLEKLIDYCENDLNREIVKAYYLEGRSVLTISKRLERSPTHIKRLLRAGVNEIANNIPPCIRKKDFL